MTPENVSSPASKGSEVVLFGWVGQCFLVLSLCYIYETIFLSWLEIRGSVNEVPASS
jgi:hypothetical protein